MKKAKTLLGSVFALVVLALLVLQITTATDILERRQLEPIIGSSDPLEPLADPSETDLIIKRQPLLPLEPIVKPEPEQEALPEQDPDEVQEPQPEQESEPTPQEEIPDRPEPVQLTHEFALPLDVDEQMLFEQVCEEASVSPSKDIPNILRSLFNPKIIQTLETNKHKLNLDLPEFFCEMGTLTKPKKYIQIAISSSKDEVDSFVAQQRSFTDFLDTLAQNRVRNIELEQQTFLFEQELGYQIEETLAPDYWRNVTGRGVDVCIIDSGVSNHSDLRVREGWSFTTNTSNYSDAIGHGTQVAGIIAGRDNDEGVVGVAPNANLFIAKAFNNATSNMSTVIEAMEWCASNYADVVSLSFGFNAHSNILKDVVDELYDDQIVVVAAAGNDASTNIAYPAAYDSVIAVGSVDQDDVLSNFSNYGELELVAYGENVYTTDLEGGYTTVSGTSFSAPVVAGVAALLFDYNSTYTAQQVRGKLRYDAQELDEDMGFGLVEVNLESANFSLMDGYNGTSRRFMNSSPPAVAELLGSVIQKKTLVIDYDSGNIICNEIREEREDNSYTSTSPDLYDCSDSDKCDRDEEEETYIQIYLGGLDVDELTVDSMTLSLELHVDDDRWADGQVRIRKVTSYYNPNSLTWDNAPSGSTVETSDDFNGDTVNTITLYDSDVRRMVVQSSNAAYDGKYVQMRIVGTDGEDDDDFFKGHMHCRDTELAIVYQECNPNDVCCSDVGRYKPAGTVCKQAHDFSCNQKTANGCGAIAYEDRCTGTSSSCPNNNYRITAPADICNGQECASATCSTSQFQPAGVCMGTSCVRPSVDECPNELTCASSSACRTQCTQDSHCQQGYDCHTQTNTCIRDDISNLQELEYDAIGNLVEDGVFSYVYDAFNNLASVYNGTQRIVSFLYDHNGQRVLKNDSGELTYYTDDAVLEDDGSNQVWSSYIQANGQLIASIEDDTLKNYVNDYRDDALLVLDEDGDVLSRPLTGPYGLSTSDQRYQFTGHEFDSESELIYMNARYYSPIFNQFTQPDSVQPNIYDPQQLNNYAYARGNPYRYVDETGNYISPLDILDYASLADSAVNMYRNPSWGNAGWLAGDIVGAVIPGLGGWGAGGKAAVRGADALNTLGRAKSIRVGGSVDEAMSVVNKAMDTLKPAEGGVNILGTKYGRIRPMQSTFDIDRIEYYRRLVRNGDDLAPIIIKQTMDANGRVIRSMDDGHHKFIAQQLEGVPMSKIPMDVDNVPYTYYNIGSKNWEKSMIFEGSKVIG